MRLALVLLILSTCQTKPGFRPTLDAGGLGSPTIYLDAGTAWLTGAGDLSFAIKPWEVKMVITEDGGWDLHCNGHCRAAGGGDVIEVRW